MTTNVRSFELTYPRLPDWADDADEWKSDSNDTFSCTYRGTCRDTRVQQTMEYHPQATDPIWYSDMLVLDRGPSCPAWCQEHPGGGDRADDDGALCHWRTVSYGDASIKVFLQEDPQPYIEPQGAAVNMGDWEWLDGTTIRNLAQALLDAADMIGVPVEAER